MSKQVVLCGAGHAAHLAGGHRLIWHPMAGCGAGFDFDKVESAVFGRNDVDFAAAAAEIAIDYCITVGMKVSACFGFA